MWTDHFTSLWWGIRLNKTQLSAQCEDERPNGVRKQDGVYYQQITRKIQVVFGQSVRKDDSSWEKVRSLLKSCQIHWAKHLALWQLLATRWFRNSVCTFSGPVKAACRLIYPETDNSQLILFTSLKQHVFLFCSSCPGLPSALMSPEWMCGSWQCEVL